MNDTGIYGGLISWAIALLVLYALVCDEMSIKGFVEQNLRILPIWVAFVMVSSYITTALLKD